MERANPPVADTTELRTDNCPLPSNGGRTVMNADSASLVASDMPAELTPCRPTVRPLLPPFPNDQSSVYESLTKYAQRHGIWEDEAARQIVNRYLQILAEARAGDSFAVMAWLEDDLRHQASHDKP